MALWIWRIVTFIVAYCIFSQRSNFAIFLHPVFITKFKILSDPERNDDGESKKDGEKDRNVFQGKDGEEGGNGNLEPFLDEDGDLNITHRYGKTHTCRAAL